MLVTQLCKPVVAGHEEIVTGNVVVSLERRDFRLLTVTFLP